jgi:gluconate 2-dehydrogenase gamma chain
MSDDELPPSDPVPPDAAPPSVPAPVTRRAALKVLGAVPLVGALGWAQQPTAQQPRQGHEAPAQPAHGAGTPPSSAPKRAFFTAAEYRTVGILADDILPRDERSPSATEVGVPAFIDFNLSVPEASEESRIAIRGGLQWLDIETRRRFGVAYAKANTTQRHAILDDISWPDKAPPQMSHGVAFFSRFRDMVASGFFSSAAGWKDLQYQGNVFNPGWNGCPEAALKKLGVTYALMDTRIKPE